MKFVYPQIDSVIEIGNDCVNSLIIENKDLFREIVEDIAIQTNGFDGQSVLSIDNTPVEMDKYAELFCEFAMFDINRKPLLNKINQALEKEALREDKYLLTSDLLRKIELYISDISFDCPCDVLCTKLSISNIIKAVGIEIADDSTDTIEKILDYMELVSEYDREKLFIMVNMRSYFSNDAMERFCKTVLEHDMKILLLESSESKKLSMEKRLIIDEDLCEI